jgi:hypothetical protein
MTFCQEYVKEVMPVLPEEIEQWHRAILAERQAAVRALDQLAKQDHERFIAVCHELLQSASLQGQEVALSELGRQGDRDDAIAEAKILAALHTPKLRETALFALGTVGTSVSFPVLLRYANAGKRCALEAASKQVRTPEERQLVLDLARSQLFSPDAHLREEAVGVFRALSSIAEEEETLLQAAKRYYDMFVLEALAEGTPRILPALEEMLAPFLPEYADYAQPRDLRYAIEGIRRRMNQAE